MIPCRVCFCVYVWKHRRTGSWCLMRFVSYVSPYWTSRNDIAALLGCHFGISAKQHSDLTFSISVEVSLFPTSFLYFACLLTFFFSLRLQSGIHRLHRHRCSWVSGQHTEKQSQVWDCSTGCLIPTATTTENKQKHENDWIELVICNLSFGQHILRPGKLWNWAQQTPGMSKFI